MSKNKIIWINGNINSGKTTTAKLLAEKLDDSVLIELDDLSAMALHLPLQEKLLFTIEDGIILAESWIERGFRPIIVYPIYGVELTFMLSILENKHLELSLFTLCAPLGILLTNRGNRVLSPWEKERIKYLYYECKIDDIEKGLKLTVEEQDPESVVSKILSSI